MNIKNYELAFNGGVKLYYKASCLRRLGGGSEVDCNFLLFLIGENGSYQELISE